MIRLFIAAATLAGGSVGTSEITTVCHIVANPAKYSGREIVIRAEFATDGVERSLLFDPSCKGKKGIGVGPELVAGALDPVVSLVNPLRIAGTGRVSALFQGKIVREKPNGFTFFKDDGFRFAVRRVTNVSVRRNGS